MPKKSGTATQHVLDTLREHHENEMTVADLFDAADGKFTKDNLFNALTRLKEAGKVTKTVDADRSAWWAITAEGMQG